MGKIIPYIVALSAAKGGGHVLIGRKCGAVGPARGKDFERALRD